MLKFLAILAFLAPLLTGAYTFPRAPLATRATFLKTITTAVPAIALAASPLRAHAGDFIKTDSGLEYKVRLSSIWLSSMSLLIS